MTVLYKNNLHKEVFGHGEPIVMLHGWAMHTGVWRVFAQTLAKNRQVVCLDLPGHGLSANITPYTLESLADAIYKELPEQVCTLVGWSLGGNIAVQLAEKYPQRIKSLVLIASNPRFIETDSWPGMPIRAFNEFATSLDKSCALTLLRFISLQVQGKSDTKSSLKHIKRTMQERATPASGELMSGLAILQSVDQTKTLTSLTMPLLMILGEKDALVPVLVGKQCQALQARMELKIIAGAGHVPFISDQKQVLTSIQDFMLRSDCGGY